MAPTEWPLPSQPGEVKCLQCGKAFYSLDKLRLRRCPRCKRKSDDYEPRMATLDDIRGALQSDILSEQGD